jgi:hypothetical protein
MGYGMDGRGSITSWDKEFLFTSQYPDWPWGQYFLISIQYNNNGATKLVRIEVDVGRKVKVQLSLFLTN